MQMQQSNIRDIHLNRKVIEPLDQADINRYREILRSSCVLEFLQHIDLRYAVGTASARDGVFQSLENVIDS